MQTASINLVVFFLSYNRIPQNPAEIPQIVAAGLQKCAVYEGVKITKIKPSRGDGGRGNETKKEK